EAVHPVAVGLAPRGHVAAGRHVVHCVQGPAGAPVEDGEVFRSGQDVSGGVAVVGVGGADHRPGAVAGPVSGFHGDFGAPVAVVVIDLELGVVGPSADVDAQVDPPQEGAVEFVGVEEDRPGVAGLGVVLGVGGLPLQDDLVAAVAVEVADAGVVGLIGVGGAVDGAARGTLQRHVQVAVGEVEGGCGGAQFHAVDDRPHCVGGVGWGAGVKVGGGGGEGGGVDAGGSAVDVERDVAGVRAEQPPAHQVPVAAAHADQSAVDPFRLAGSGGFGEGGCFGFAWIFWPARRGLVSAYGAVEGEGLGDADRAVVGGVEAKTDGAARGDASVPGSVGGGDLGAVGLELSVPPVGDPLPGREAPTEGPAVDGVAQVGDGDGSSETVVPLVDAVVDAAYGGGVGWAGESRSTGGTEHECGKGRAEAHRS